MKRIYASLMIIVSVLGITSVLSPTATSQVNTVTKKSGVTIVNTTEIGKSIRGFKGPVPLEVSIKKGKIIGVKALPNSETPAYFNKLSAAGLFDKWNGLTLKQAAEAKVDAVSGATYSSKAVIENVKAAVKQVNK